MMNARLVIIDRQRSCSMRKLRAQSHDCLRNRGGLRAAPAPTFVQGLGDQKGFSFLDGSRGGSTFVQRKGGCGEKDRV